MRKSSKWAGRWFNAFLIVLAITVAGAASASAQLGTGHPIVYKDENGQVWNRWILTEPNDGGTLLLVVEDAQDAAKSTESVTERVLFRARFGANREAALKQAITHYRSLADRKDGEGAIEDPSRGPSGPTPQDHKPLWVAVRNQWTQDDEKDYAAWYTANVTTSLLVGSGIVVDCADFAVSVRWIYAHDHKLPVANTLAGNGKLFGQWSGASAWDSLPTDPDWHKDQRFKAGLKYLLDSTYTRSIVGDLYPVALSRDYIAPGGILLILWLANSGHTEVINTLDKDEMCPVGGCMTVLYGNEPSAQVAYKDIAWIVNRGQSYGGFLRWRWPHLSGTTWKLTASQSMPGYSLEQYQQPDLSDDEFETFVFQKLSIGTDPLSQALSIGNSLISQLDQRLTLTTRGYFYCYLPQCATTSPEYDAYSTPGHDSRFRQSRDQFLAQVAQLDPTNSYWQRFVQGAKTPLFGGGTPTYYDYMTNAGGVSDQMASDPTVPFNQRWALPTDAENLIWQQQAIWAQGWYDRDYAVYYAQDACYPNGGTTPSCDPTSSQVKALSTATLDAGLKPLQTSLKGLLGKVSSSTNDQITQIARTNESWAELCRWNSDGYCTEYDFLLSGSGYVQKMSSDPTAIYTARYGM